MRIDYQKKISKKGKPQSIEGAHNIWRQSNEPLDAIFRPKSIAVIGASEKQGSVGLAVASNLIHDSFKGALYFINPKHPSILGVKTHPSVAEVPEDIDLAVIATKAETVPGVIKECVDKGVKGAVIISAGFKELGAPGAALEARIMAEAAKGDIRIIGPNCLGVMNPMVGLNATFASRMAYRGNVGFISQSGALCTAILDWSLREHVGFSAFISIGSMLDLNWGDLIDYLGDDPHTKSILLYMESIGDAKSFLSAAREVSLTKPIIVLKTGRTSIAAKAAISHTGSIAGSDKVLDAAFRRAGVLRVDRIEELFDMADILAKQPRPRGPRLSIVTNAGGPGVLATDALINAGGEIAELSKDTMELFNGFLPEHWSHNDPIDILGDAGPDRYAKALDIATKNPQSDGQLVILTPQAMTDATQTAEILRTYAKIEGKPVLASWMGAGEVAAGKKILSEAGIPVFTYPDEAARMFCYMWKYSDNLRGLYETPSLVASDAEPAHSKRSEAHALILNARQNSRTLLTEVESKKLLAAYGIPVVETFLARSASEAVKLAEKIGYPVVLKLYSESLTHKTDVGGVKLNLGDAEAVKTAYDQIESSVNALAGTGHFQGVAVQSMVSPAESYELVIGSTIDAQFGPVILFGTGGQLVEIFKDHALALPPLNTTLARRMMERTKIYKALKGVRGRSPADLAFLGEILVRFSQMVIEMPWIREIDINPMLVSSQRILALDARVILHDSAMQEKDLPRPVIRPYPVQYTTHIKIKNGEKVTIRPICPEDEPLMVEFHRMLSELSVRRRYFSAMGLDQRIAHERLVKVCFNNYDREMALVADREDPKTGKHEIVAVGRLSRLRGIPDAEFSMVVSDKFQNLGLGAQLLRFVIEVAGKEKIRTISADILSDNLAMQNICRKLGFNFKFDNEEKIIKVTMKML